jgi:hypothetical protein
VLEGEGDIGLDRAPRQQGEILEDVGERIERIGRQGAGEGDATLGRLQQAA